MNAAQRKGNITSIDVARLARVSQSAVSRSFTEGASVADSTRQRVLAAAQQLGYRPNAIARALTTNRSRIIAVVVSNLHNQFYPLVLETLSKRLQYEGYHVLLFITDTEDADDLLVELLAYQVDGIVMASTTLSSGLASQIADARIPIVMFNRTSRAGSISTVSSDNYDGGRMVGHFLAGGGHGRIAYLAGTEDSSTNLDRERGFVDGLGERGLKLAMRAVGDYDFLCAAQAARALFMRKRPPDAVFVASDHMAFAVMDTLRFELGLRIPEDVSVVGFDNAPPSAWGAYQLTTVEQSAGPMIEATVAMLMQQLDDDAVSRDHVVVPVRLVTRRSARMPSGTGEPPAAKTATRTGVSRTQR